MVLGLGKLKSGVKKMFRSSEDLASESSKDVKKHTSDKGRRRSLVLENHFSPSSSRSTTNLSTKVAALNLAETSTSASFDDSSGDCGNLSVNGTFFRRKCLEESVEEEKENVATHQQFPSLSTSPSNNSALGAVQRYYRQPSMGIQAKEIIQGIPRKRSRDLTEELKKARLRKSQSLSHLKYVNEEGDEIQCSYEYELGTSIFESHQTQHAPPPVPKPRLSLLQKQDPEISEASSGVERKRPLITPRTSSGTVSLNSPAMQPTSIGNRGGKKENQEYKIL